MDGTLPSESCLEMVGLASAFCALALDRLIFLPDLYHGCSDTYEKASTNYLLPEAHRGKQDTFDQEGI